MHYHVTSQVLVFQQPQCLNVCLRSDHRSQLPRRELGGTPKPAGIRWCSLNAKWMEVDGSSWKYFEHNKMSEFTERPFLCAADGVLLSHRWMQTKRNWPFWTATLHPSRSPLGAVAQIATFGNVLVLVASTRLLGSNPKRRSPWTHKIASAFALHPTFWGLLDDSTLQYTIYIYMYY